MDLYLKEEEAMGIMITGTTITTTTMNIIIINLMAMDLKRFNFVYHLFIMYKV
jgi:hypothetical protein